MDICFLPSGSTLLPSTGFQPIKYSRFFAEDAVRCLYEVKVLYLRLPPPLKSTLVLVESTYELEHRVFLPIIPSEQVELLLVVLADHC